MSPLLPRWAAILNYRAGEGRLLSLLLLLFFLKGISDVFFATTASTLYLQQFGSLSLPWVYLASALVVTLLGLAYSRFTIRIIPSRLLRLILIGLVVSIALLHLALVFAASRWWALALMVWREVNYMLLNATFWARIGLLLNVRQGKRLFPVIAGGDIASSALGGAVIPFVVRSIGPLHLLFFSEVSLALCVAVSVAIDRAAPATGVAEENETVEPDRRPLGQLVRDRYLALFFGLSIASFLIYFFADYNFYDVVNRRFTDAAALASFFGVFYAVVNAANLLVNGFIAGRMLTRYGIAVGLMAVPVVVGFCTLGALALPALAFWAIVGTKMADEIFRWAFLYPTYRILYLPLSVRERLRVQAVRDSIVEPVAVGLSGALILALTRLAGFDVTHLAVVLLLVVLVFTGLSVALRREYGVILGRALAQGRELDDATLGPIAFSRIGVRHTISVSPDAQRLLVLRRRARSERSGESVYCLGLLEKTDPVIAGSELLEALRHQAPDVRLYALRRLREINATDAVRSVAALIDREPVTEVLGAALWTLADLSRAGRACHERLSRYLDHQDAAVRHGTLTGALRNPGIWLEAAARAELEAMVVSVRLEDRETAARVIGDVGASGFAGLLVRLLADVERQVVRAALAAAGQLRDPALLPALAGHLDDPELRDAAAAALIRFGDAGVPPLALRIEGATDRREAVRAIRLLAGGGTPAALERLLAHATHPDENIRHVVLRVLARMRFSAGAAHTAMVQAALEEEIGGVAALLAARQELGDDKAAELVGRGLDNDVAESTDRVLLLLSLLYSPQTILDARTILQRGNEEQRARAIEAVDSLLPRSLAGRVVPLLDDLTVPERLRRMGGAVAPRAQGVAQRLGELIGKSGYALSHWTRACAVYEAARLDGDLRAAIRAAVSDPVSLVRETARGLA